DHVVYAMAPTLRTGRARRHSPPAGEFLGHRLALLLRVRENAFGHPLRVRGRDDRRERQGGGLCGYRTLVRERVEAELAVVITHAGPAHPSERQVVHGVDEAEIVAVHAAGAGALEEPAEVRIVLAVPVAAQRAGAVGQ